MTNLETLIAEIEKEFPEHIWLVRSDDNCKRYFANIFDPHADYGTSTDRSAYGPTPVQALMGARMQARNAKQEQTE